MHKNYINETVECLIKTDLVLIKTLSKANGYNDCYIDPDRLIVAFKQTVTLLTKLLSKSNFYKIYFLIKNKMFRNMFQGIIKDLKLDNTVKFVVNMSEIRKETNPSIVFIMHNKILKNVEKVVSYNLPSTTHLIFNVTVAGKGYHEGLYNIPVQCENISKILYFVFLIQEILRFKHENYS